MASRVPSTTFSGSSNPNGGNGDTRTVKYLAMAVLVLFAPVAAVVAFITYMLFQLARIPWKTLLAVTAVYAAIYALWVLAFDHTPITTYIMAWFEGKAAYASGGLDALEQQAGERWTLWLTATAPLGILIGLAVGTGMAMWRWMRRPAWETYEVRRTPWEVMRARRIEREIKQDVNGPKDGTTVGIDDNLGQKVVQTDHEAVMHTFLVGTTGSGKSTAELMSLRDAIRRGQGVVVIDLKGADDLPETLASWAEEHGREFQHFLFHALRGGTPYTGPARKGPAFYDPAGRGDPSRRKDLLVGSQKWTEEYYKNVVENYLQLAFIADDLIKPYDTRPTLDRVAELLVPENLQALALRGDEKWREVFRAQEFREAIMRVTTGLEPGEKSAIRSMYSRLQVLRASIAGDYLRSDPFGTDNTIDLYATASEGRVVVFSLDASNYQDTARQIAGLIVQDLKTLSSELRTRPANNLLHVFIDEFAEIGSDNVIGLMNKCRASDMPVTISTQSLHDLARVEPTFIGQILDVANTFKIMRANTEESALIFAGLAGKEMQFKKRYAIEMDTGIGGMIGVGASTGGGSVDQIEDYRVPPRVFQHLKRGEMVYITKSPDFQVRPKVRVVAAIPEPVRERFVTSQAWKDGGTPTGAASGTPTPNPAGMEEPYRSEFMAEIDMDTTIPALPEVGASFDERIVSPPLPTRPTPVGPAPNPVQYDEHGWPVTDSQQAAPIPPIPALPAHASRPGPANPTRLPAAPIPPAHRSTPLPPPPGNRVPLAPPPGTRPAAPRSSQNRPPQPVPTRPAPPHVPPASARPPVAPTQDLPPVGEDW